LIESGQRDLSAHERVADHDEVIEREALRALHPGIERRAHRRLPGDPDGGVLVADNAARSRWRSRRKRSDVEMPFRLTVRKRKAVKG
jgi:hypothetical protein